MLFEQRFAAFDDRSTFAGYSVVTCERCGFVYADGIPDQGTFDRYYREMSKYEERGGLSAADSLYYKAAVARIAERLPNRSARLLDVGSACGDALALFKEIGYTNLTGFDPSPLCAQIAHDRYGLRVINTPISHMPFAGERFDVVMLSGVLEHLRDLGQTLNELRRLLTTDGAFWFAVPDASRFGDFVEAPYQHFSLEHINFFTLTTLRALLSRAGFELVDHWQSLHRIGAMAEPVINAVFRPSSTAQTAVVHDLDGAQAVLRYVAESERLEEKLWKSVSRFDEDQTPVIVWGTGTLTLHLLGTERFGKLNVVAFVDSNPNYWGKSLRDIPVVAPADIAARSEAILVVSYAYEQQIAQQIRDVYHLRNDLVTLFSALGNERAA